MPDRIRVAALIGNLNREHGGAQQLLFDVFSNLPDDFEPSVHYMFGPGTFREDFERAGVTVHPLRAGSNGDPAAFGRLLQALRRDRPHLLETNSPISGVWGRLAARMAGVPRVVSVEHSVHDAYRPVPRLVNGLTLPLADAVVGVSPTVVDSLAGWERALLPAGTVVRSIPNGVDLERFAPPGPDGGPDGDGPVVGTLGRLIEAKGVDRLLRAWPAVAEAVPDARLRIVGDGPMRGTLEELTAELDVADSVTFTGYVADPVPAYRSFDVAAFPSRWEGLPLTALEAMAAEVPVVASDIPAFRHVLGADGEAGLLVPGGEAAALADGIVRLLRDPDRRRRLGAAGRERVRERFSLERVVGEYEALFRELVAG